MHLHVTVIAAVTRSVIKIISGTVSEFRKNHNLRITSFDNADVSKRVSFQVIQSYTKYACVKHTQTRQIVQSFFLTNQFDITTTP